ncbi:hypothetical protein KJE20_12958 [Pyrenophora tritici-repentis]|nr:hypothetical protein KJE20_12958 [Pyrenophora tritici-repentis]
MADSSVQEDLVWIQPILNKAGYKAAVAESEGTPVPKFHTWSFLEMASLEAAFGSDLAHHLVHEGLIQVDSPAPAPRQSAPPPSQSLAPPSQSLPPPRQPGEMLWPRQTPTPTTASKTTGSPLNKRYYTPARQACRDRAAAAAVLPGYPKINPAPKENKKEEPKKQSRTERAQTTLFGGQFA